MEIQKSPLPAPLLKPPKFGMDKVFEGNSGHSAGFYQGDPLLAWKGFISTSMSKACIRILTISLPLLRGNEKT